MKRYINPKIKQCYPTGTRAGTWTAVLDAERVEGKVGEIRELHLKLTPCVAEYKAETYYLQSPGKTQIDISDVPFKITETIKQFFTDVVLNDTAEWQTNAAGHTHYYHPAFGRVKIFDRAKCGHSSNIIFH